MNNAKYLRYAFCATLMLGIAPQTLSMDDLTRKSDEQMEESRILFRKNQGLTRKNQGLMDRNQGLMDRNQELETESESLEKKIDRNDKTTRSLEKACYRNAAAYCVMGGSLLVWLGWELYSITPRTNQRNKSSY